MNQLDLQEFESNGNGKNPTKLVLMHHSMFVFLGDLFLIRTPLELN